MQAYFQHRLRSGIILIQQNLREEYGVIPPFQKRKGTFGLAWLVGKLQKRFCKIDTGAKP